MLIFERSYDKFMIFSCDKFIITNFQSYNLWFPLTVNKKKDHLSAKCRQMKQRRPNRQAISTQTVAERCKICK